MTTGGVFDAAWPPAQPIPSERVLSGSPRASTICSHTTAQVEFGLWKVTPGSFSTARRGHEECIYVIEGDGDLVSDDGAVTHLEPGVTAVLPDGWTGRWVIRSPLTKVYTLVSTSDR